MKRGLHNITGEAVRKAIREMLSPTFLLILSGVTLFWFASRLNIQYPTEMSLSIRIDGEKYRFDAIVSGRGSAIMARRLSLKRRPDFTLEELSYRRSNETPGALTMNKVSLQRATNNKINDPDFTIVEVVDAPEFIPPTVESEDDATTETAKERRQRKRKERREARQADKAAETESEKAEEK